MLSTQYSELADVRESTVRDYISLMKPGVMTLVVFTGACGALLAPGISSVHPFIFLLIAALIALGSGASGAINMWYDRDIDAVMKRTQKRPIPAGRVEPENALEFGSAIAVFSVIIMGVAVNWLAAFLLAFAIFFYVYIYTVRLKRSTPQNIVIGGAAGAFPPMIGWAAVTGDVSLMPVLLFALIFLWTPPHFWALALYKNEDYKRANVPMMPVVRGDKHTKRLMLLYTLVLLPVSLAPYFIAFSGHLYGICALILGAGFIRHAVKVLKDDSNKAAPAMFGYSIIYLFALFAALVADKLAGNLIMG